jgi:hypothetical protein
LTPSRSGSNGFIGLMRCCAARCPSRLGSSAPCLFLRCPARLIGNDWEPVNPPGHDTNWLIVDGSTSMLCCKWWCYVFIYYSIIKFCSLICVCHMKYTNMSFGKDKIFEVRFISIYIDMKAKQQKLEAEACLKNGAQLTLIYFTKSHSNM